MNQAGNLFQLQTELIDMKVDMAANKAIEKVIDGISGLKDQMMLMDNRLETRLVAVETKLGIVNETEKEIKARVFASQTHVKSNVIDYTFRAGWLLLASITTYFLVHFHLIIK